MMDLYDKFRIICWKLNYCYIAGKIYKMLKNKEPNRVLLHMPTGLGKTRTTMNVISEHLRENEPTLVIWLAASEELCEQAVEEFQKAWSHLGNRNIEVYRLWGNHSIDINNLKEGFLVAGFAKLTSTIKKVDGIQLISRLASRCSLVIMDEAHQL